MNSRKVPLYVALARNLIAVRNCEKSGNAEWLARHRERILRLVKQHMPSGAGFDNGTAIDLDESMPSTASGRVEKLVFRTAFHHMNEVGMYDGWTEHTVTVRPSLAFGIEISISGRNRNEIKDLIHESFDTTLRSEVSEFGDV